MIRLPGDRVFRDPRLDALPKDLFGQVGRETADDRLETFCAIRRGLRSGFFLFLLARRLEIGRGHRDRVIDTSCSSSRAHDRSLTPTRHMMEKKSLFLQDDATSARRMIKEDNNRVREPKKKKD